MHRVPHGFTLIELLVVISIIAILSGALYINFSAGSAQSRDADRRADLRNLQTAIELYKNKYGRYPEGCRGPTTGTTPVWSGQRGTAYACTSGDQYVVGLAPEFIRALPPDPKLSGVNSGYVYTTNAQGSVYKVMALNTVESLDVPLTDEFARCGPIDPSTGPSWSDVNICARSPRNALGNNPNDAPTYNECNNQALRDRTFALSGGFSGEHIRPGLGTVLTTDRAKEFDTEIVRCR